LIAADISQIALERAAKRCSLYNNVQFRQLDVSNDILPTSLDLIVCSEMLYFLPGIDELRAVAAKITEALKPGGYLLMTHHNLVVDEPDRPGIDWDHPFGAKGIGTVFVNTPSLRLVKELHTPLYRVQLYRREGRIRLPFIQIKPQLIEMAQPESVPPEIQRQVLWHGGKPSIDPNIYTINTPLLSWNEIRQLRDEGVLFGSRTTSHVALTGLSAEEAVRELVRSRTTLMEELKQKLTAIAYPWGDTDRRVQHLSGASGYVFGFGDQPRLSNFTDRLLELPRLEITGQDTLSDFVRKLRG
jgi:hypothetical protein